MSKVVKNVSKSDARTRGAETGGGIASIDLLSGTDLSALTASGVRTLDDLADLASDELLDIVGLENMTRECADKVIMAARAHWFAEAR